jgi:uncharacterized protein (TIGR02145 family)
MNGFLRLFLISLVYPVCLFSLNCSSPASPEPVYGADVIDIDGNVYHSVIIGNQTWMAANLRTTKYNDGSSIPIAIAHDTTPGYRWYNDDSLANKDSYGALYNWFAVATGKLAPQGWHVATVADWNILLNHIGKDAATGGKLKETGTTHWQSPNTAATNETGFTALPGGMFNFDGLFINMGVSGWFITPDTAMAGLHVYAKNFVLLNTDGYIHDMGPEINTSCLSVRCVKD